MHSFKGKDLQVLAINSVRVASRQLWVPLGTFNLKLRSHILAPQNVSHGKDLSGTVKGGAGQLEEKQLGTERTNSTIIPRGIYA